MKKCVEIFNREALKREASNRERAADVVALLRFNASLFTVQRFNVFTF